MSIRNIVNYACNIVINVKMILFVWIVIKIMWIWKAYARENVLLDMELMKTKFAKYVNRTVYNVSWKKSVYIVHLESYLVKFKFL